MIHHRNVVAAVGVLRWRRPACAIPASNTTSMESVMSLSSMANVGKGAMLVGFAAEPGKFE